MNQLIKFALLLFIGSIYQGAAAQPNAMRSAMPIAVTNAVAAKSVRMVYLVPSDKIPNSAYKRAIETAIMNVQQWYLQKVGLTFTLSNPVVEVVRSTHPASWFNTESTFWKETPQFWFNANTITDVKNLYGPSFNQEKFIWVVYVDAKGETGAGGGGMATLPEHDILGVSGLHPIEKQIPRWHGGLAHEIGHAFGLSHAGEAFPDALMKYGYTKYPNCTLTQQDLNTLTQSPFFNSSPTYDAKYVYSTGTFTKRGNTWIEIATNPNAAGGHSEYHFRELTRTEYFYTIEDKSRNIKLKIPIQDGWSYYQTTGEWQRLYSVKKAQ
jgi:hypothetical protein